MFAPIYRYGSGFMSISNAPYQTCKLRYDGTGYSNFRFNNTTHVN